jgi:hypothetical protein
VSYFRGLSWCRAKRGQRACPSGTKTPLCWREATRVRGWPTQVHVLAVPVSLLPWLPGGARLTKVKWDHFSESSLKTAVVQPNIWT